ncbi:MAG: rRNA maturation RNase YbeY [Proteobacteria bacterium]|jgi:probable rRNA maturation factor|nr:rRNA maturation RNase YbeY [Pseudomonadota bacterium]
MRAKIDLQNDESLTNLPVQQDFETWVNAALVQKFDNLEQTIRLVGEAESRALNSQYRAKNAPTNVLSFTVENDYLDYECLGDLVICAPIVEQEAQQQGKPLPAHWAHMVIHGMLHLQGYDHQNAAEADEMEALEAKILSTLGYTNPYNV